MELSGRVRGFRLLIIVVVFMLWIRIGKAQAEDHVKIRHKRQNGQIGSPCFYNTDCLSSMYCNGGRCICLSNYIQRDNFCYEKINPGQSGCVYNEQCAAVWSRATCLNGVCVCPSVAAINSGPLIPVQTRDGVVCASDSYCPLPIDDGLITVLEPTVAVCTSARDCAKATTFNDPGAETISQLYECSAITACCPNRAFTCSSPMGAPPSTGVGFWYNSASGQCQQIPNTNNNLAINSNNFATMEHCQSYCAASCPRGNSQYSNDRVQTCSGNSGSCDNSHQCVLTGVSQQRCCPRPSFICSKSGGISPIPTSQSTEYNPGFQASTFGTPSAITRYYYDSSTRQCSTFAYLGAGGNFNNFATQSECQSFCLQQMHCTKGGPLLDPSGQLQRCTSSVPCPVTHSCTNSVCCPTRQTICSQPVQQGTCGSQSFVQSSPRFWYNSNTKQCEQFSFSGCQGNENNFATLLECQSFCKATAAEPQCPQGKALRDSSGNFLICSSIGSALSITVNQCAANFECHFDGSLFGCCPRKSYTCSLGANRGIPCGPSSVRWSFDTRTQSCSSFTYLGCDGNSNNFPSQEECESYCGVPTCPNGGQAFKDPVTSKVLLCSSSGFACPQTHECTLIGGTVSTPISLCCPSRAFICIQPPDIGHTCHGVIQSPVNLPSQLRYYFSPISKTCQQFSYLGCGGSGNNFQGQNRCLSYCTSAACPHGQSVYISPSSRAVASCSDGIAGMCPSGYVCIRDHVWRRNVCCGSTNMGVCPPTDLAYVESSTGEARICAPNLANPCPESYTCKLSQAKNRYYCCSPSKFFDFCPLGSSALQSANGNPRVCTVGSINQCPPNYDCVSSFSNSTSGYCCWIISPVTASPPGVVDLCGSPNLVPYEISPGSPAVCDPVRNICPIGYACRLHAATNVHYCCRNQSGPVDQQSCPNNQQPFIDGSTGLVKECGSTLLTGQCPLGYSCMLGSKNTPICCLSSSPASTTLTCPRNKSLEMWRNRPLSCDNGICLIGSTCYVLQDGKKYCCKSVAATKCPSGRRPHINPYTNFFTTCKLNGSCPRGYNCYSNTPMTIYGVCCSRMDYSSSVFYACPNGGRPFLYQPTRSPLVCSPGEDMCPRGFACQRAANRQFYCCSVGISYVSTYASSCPNGMRPLGGSKPPVDSNLGFSKAQECVPSTPYPCPSPYQCVLSLSDRYRSTRFHCCASNDLDKWAITYKTGISCPSHLTAADGRCMIQRFKKRKHRSGKS